MFSAYFCLEITVATSMTSVSGRDGERKRKIG